MRDSIFAQKWVSNGTCYRKDFRAKSTVYDCFKLWKEKPCEDKPSLLEQALKKCGWGGPYQQWTQGLPDAIAVTTAGVTDRKGGIGSFYPSQEIVVGGGQSSGRWPMAPIRASLLQTALLKYLEKRAKLPSVMSITLLK